MASRMKRIFHRKKDSEDVSPPPQRASDPSRSEPALRTSLYEATSSDGLPHSGDYPLKGNDSSVFLQQQGRKSSLRSRPSSGSHYNRSPTPDQHTTQRHPAMAANDGVDSDVHASRLQKSPTPAAGQNGQKRRSRTQLPEDFSNMSLGNTGPTTVTQTVTTTAFSPGPYNARREPPTAAVPASKNATIRPVNDSAPLQNHESKAPQPNAISKPSTYDERQLDYNGNSPPRVSIPRKQVGASVAPESPTQQPPSPSRLRKTGNGQAFADKPLPVWNPQSQNATASPSQAFDPRESTMPARSSANPGGAAAPMGAREIVERARTNTKQTHVTEAYAPAVVHETVNKKVHHVREELITREVHNHDVYHRMLPVIDVEVLPPRHFLPVEGGGLVEVGAHEVPGRGNNWVIAETASKIPSDQPAPAGSRAFTARTFPGRDGDAQRYAAPEGHERTEQTWVHPPVLETGARDTGQSWPIVFGEDTPKKGSYGYNSAKPAKKTNKSKRTAAGYQSPPQREASLGKTTG